MFYRVYSFRDYIVGGCQIHFTVSPRTVHTACWVRPSRMGVSAWAPPQGSQQPLPTLDVTQSPSGTQDGWVQKRPFGRACRSLLCGFCTPSHDSQNGLRKVSGRGAHRDPSSGLAPPRPCLVPPPPPPPQPPL